MSTITSANVQFALGVANLYPAPQLIQGFATDDAFAFPDVKPSEVLMGVDGVLSGGYTPYPVEMEVMLQADSASNLIFDTWLQAQVTANEVYTASATIIYPALSTKYTFTRGFLTVTNPVPTAKKVLQPRKFQITWQSCSPAPL